MALRSSQIIRSLGQKLSIMRYLALTFNSLDEEDNEEDWKPLDHTSVNNAIMTKTQRREAEDVDSAEE